MITKTPCFKLIRKHDPAYSPGAFRLHDHMVYSWEAKGVLVTVPAGTVTDFASIPRGFRNLISVNGLHVLPAVLHDYLYSKAGTLDTLQVVRYTRKEADDEFLRAMRAEGVGPVTAWLMHKAVRLFGGIHLKLTGGRSW